MKLILHIFNRNTFIMHITNDKIKISRFKTILKIIIVIK